LSGSFSPAIPPPLPPFPPPLFSVSLPPPPPPPPFAIYSIELLLNLLISPEKPLACVEYEQAPPFPTLIV